MHFANPTVLLLAALPQSYAWGDLGHQTIAYIAQHYVAPATATWAQGILKDTSTSYLANVATWADSYRETKAGAFSESFHFIDAQDNPPSSCNVDYSRDCGATGCVISALQNYTSRVTDTSLSTTEINYAMRFIVHFVGDMHQPLHDEAGERGGNEIDVLFDGAKGNLHAIWDTQIPEKSTGGYGLTVAAAWGKNLSAAIDSGIYKSQAKTWITGIDVGDVVGSTTPWASEANAYVCSVVIPQGFDAVEGEDLGENGYYQKVLPTVDLQIARAGRRLAAWLDAIAQSQSQSKSTKSSGHKARNYKDL